MDLGRATPQARGEALGEAQSRALHEAAARLEAISASTEASVQSAQVACCQAFVDALRGRYPDTYAELTGIAQGAQIPLAVVAQLNLLGDSPLGEAATDGAMLGTSTAIHASGSGGVVMAGAVLGGVLGWAVTLTTHEEEGRRVALLRGPGGLGWVGVNDLGLAIIPAHPRWCTSDPRGEAWPVLLRRVLSGEGVRRARDILSGSIRRGGRYWLVSDGAESLGMESSPERLAVTRRGAKAAHVHTDHFFDVGFRSKERAPIHPRSLRRMELASSIYVQRRPEEPEALFEFLTELDRTHGATGDAGPEDADHERLGPSVQFVAQCEARTLSVSATLDGVRVTQRLDVSP
jgi:hypothetical protein